MKFKLGTHLPNWVTLPEFDGTHLFISHRRLLGKQKPVRTLPRARPRIGVSIDSGGFSYLQTCGEFPISAAEYVAAARRYDEEISNIEWITPQDWMCEDAIINGGWYGPLYFVGTIRNYVEICDLWGEDLFEADPDNPKKKIIPVLQGKTRDDYMRCADGFEAAGVQLERCHTVGIGSVCRRENTTEIKEIFEAFPTLNKHGFGVKIGGIRRYGHLLKSSDSLAWSAAGVHLPGCPPVPGKRPHKNEANCRRWALEWYGDVLDVVEESRVNSARSEQRGLWDLSAWSPPAEALSLAG
jgi:hypothetical protein